MWNRFINKQENIVTESINGLVLSSPDLARLDGYPDIKVVAIKSWDKDVHGKEQVALISGGGAGHEPAHSGFVGEGFLTAAVSGEIFASPSVEAILAAIRAVTGAAGCLLIIKNYTGDRLNFGLAAEIAKSHYSLNVEMVIVGDDRAIETEQARGLAGTLLIHKIAGALSAQRVKLKEIKGVVEETVGKIATIGLSLSNCNIPGGEPKERIKSGEIELGLGIHGEPGASTMKLKSARHLIDLLLEQLANHIPKHGELLAFLNGLGTVPPMELNILASDLMQSNLASRISMLLGPAQMMTSLDMNGVSLSILPLSENLKELLRFKVSNTFWNLTEYPSLDLLPCPEYEGISFLSSSHPTTEKVLKHVCEALIAKKDELNDLDFKVGDGDAGTTFSLAAKRILEKLPSLPLKEPKNLSLALGQSLASAGGSSGVLLSIFFTAVGKHLTDGGDWDQGALKAGLQAMSNYGGAKLGDRTMLDAMIPAIEQLNRGLSFALDAAKSGFEKTKSIHSTSSGRSSYLSADRLKGTPDPGAAAVVCVLEAICEVVEEKS
ncbi:MAG: dihydroxyacetone kinase subunit DhaK [Oligoflexales bacterium]